MINVTSYRGLMAASITDVLSHPGWTVAATLLGLAGIVTAILLYRRGRARKALSYGISNTALVSVRSEAREDIEISYRGNPVRAVNLVTFRLTNVGNVPVVEDDFERPLRLRFPSSAVPLTVEVEEARPSDLRPVATIDGAGVIVEPLLLNPGDSFTVAALVRDLRRGGISVDARVAGVSTLSHDDGRGGSASEGFTASLSRMLATVPIVLGVSVAIPLVAGATAAVAIYVEATKKENSLVTRTDGRAVCAKVLRVDSDRIVLQLNGTGHVEVVPMDQVASIRDKTC